MQQVIQLTVEHTTYQTIYWGKAKCYTQGEWLAKYYSYSILRSVHLSKGSGLDYKSCWAEIPFERQQASTTEICDYKPTTPISLYRVEGDTTAIVTLNGSDQDGSITRYELWVDGVRQTGNTAQLVGAQGDSFEVRGRVTDNDGDTTETSKSVSLIFRPPARYDKYLC
ncbi:hypothetical protein PA25_05150 [Pseudoalteromonas sp. A25]|uniref:hypothetical protein n=1 Tax=Pseudoalteromonas sp. A25 TaxID=116092 RepID=UPI001260A045|nr:hypothetical protein [Pseudoalteromonas sp. A25]BBN80530.1 hypothetical protein PA25_05150 [Pseudoalteromonas sp. A25]